MTDSLRKIYYTDRKHHEETYRRRKESPFTRTLAVEIQEFNHERKFPCFYYYTEELTLLIERLYVKYHEFADVLRAVPPVMLQQLSLFCIVDEVKATVSIEGIHSSKKELKALLDGEEPSGNLMSILKKYEKLMAHEHIDLDTAEDIRLLYNELAYREVLRDNPRNKLDGRLFRAGDVDIVSPSGKILHRGISGEDKIEDMLDLVLGVMKDESIPFFVRLGLFHYIFVYIHPFYDGNGRTARFISSCQIAERLHYLAGLRLSYIIKSRQKQYYEMIHNTEMEINCGDITPFIVGFARIIYDTLEDLCSLITRKIEQYHKYLARLEAMMPEDDTSRNIYQLMLEGSMFFGRGVSMEELMMFTGKSRNTVKARLRAIPSGHFIERSLNRKYYSLNLLMLKE